MRPPPPEPRQRRCGVAGSPIGHSLSPVIHRAAYAELGLDWRYTAHDIDAAGFPGFLGSLDDTWRGLSVTMPLKRIALDLAAHASDIARTVGAANTLVRSGGIWWADNTDVYGARAALGERGVTTARSVCLWGGGATAASVLAALAAMAAGPVHLHVRSVRRARDTLAVAEALGHEVRPAPWDVGDACRRSEVTVSTAPSPALEPVLDRLAASAESGRALFDVIYDPWPTPLATRWLAAGGTVVSGLDLLVHQAVGQIELMTGHRVGAAALRRAAPAGHAGRATR